MRVQWMRQDEHGWDPKGPPQLLDVRGGIDPSGNIVAWETEMWLPRRCPGSRPLVGVDAAGMKQDHARSGRRLIRRMAIRRTRFPTFAS